MAKDRSADASTFDTNQGKSARGRIAHLTPAERKRIASLGAAARWGPTEPVPDPFPGLEPDRAILLAATSLFAKGGFDRPTLRQVAEAAGVGLQTIYRYYSNKRELYLACCANLLNEYMRYFDGMIARNSDPATRLYALALGLADTHFRPDLTRLIHRELLDPGSEAVNQAYGSELAPHFANYFAVADELGCDAAAERVVAMISLIMGVVQFQPVPDLVRVVAAMPSEIDEIASFALRMSFPGIDWEPVRDRVEFKPFALDARPSPANG